MIIGKTARAFRFGLVRLLRILALLVLLLLLTIVLILKTSPGRNLIRIVAEAVVTDILPGRLTVDRVAKVGLLEVRLEGVTLFDPSGRRVIAVAEVLAAPDLRAIIGGVIELERVALRDPEVTLIVDADGQLSLVSTFAGPATPTDQDEEEQPSGEPTIVSIPDLSITGGVVHTSLPSAMGLHIEDLALQGAFRLEDAITSDVEQLSLAIVDSDGTLLRIDPLRAHVDTASGSENTVMIILSNEVDHIEVQLTAIMPSDDAPLTLQADLSLDPLTSTLLGPLGLSDLVETVPARIVGEIAVEGTLEELHGEIDLETEGGPLHLVARVFEFERFEVELSTDGVQLSDVAPALPEMFVAADFEGAMTLLESGAMHFEARTGPTTIDAYEIPPLLASATLDNDGVTIEELQFPDLGSGLTVTGTVGMDGSADVTVRTADLKLDDDPNFRSLVSDVGGTIEVDMRLQYEAGDQPTVNADGLLRVDDLNVPGFGADSILVDGSARGDLTSPRVELAVQASGLSASGVEVNRVDIRATGGPSRYQLVGDVSLVDGTAASIDIEASRTAQRVAIQGDVSLTHDGETISTRLSDLQIEDSGAIRLGRALVRYQDASIDLTGRYRTNGHISAEADLRDFSLAMLSDIPGVPELPVSGIATAHVTFEGRPDRPEIDLDLDLREGSFGPVTEANLDLQLQYGSRGANVRGRFELGDVGVVTLRADTEFSRRRDPMRALRRADYDLAVEFEDVDLAALLGPSPEEAALKGLVSGTVVLTGSLDEPDLLVTAQVPSLEVSGVTPVDVSTRLEYASGKVALAVDVSDETGSLITIEAGGGLPWDPDDPASMIEVIPRTHWQAQLSMPERKLDTLPVDLGDMAEIPVFASLEAAFTDQPDTPPVGDVRIVLRGDSDDERTEAARCPSTEPVVLTVNAHFADNLMLLEVDTTQKDRRVVTITSTIDTPLEDWIVSGLPTALPELNLDATIDELHLESLPVVCHESAGAIDGWVQVAGLLSATPSFDMELQADQLTVPDGVPVDLIAAIHASQTELLGDITVSSEQGGHAEIRAQAPIVWGAESLAPALGEGEISVRADFNEFTIAPFATLTPVLRRGRGRLDGALDVGGTTDRIDPSGELSFTDLDVMIPGLDQRLSGVSGGVRIVGEQIVIENVRARDHQGSITLDGTIDVVDRSSLEVALTLNTNDFPARSGGVIVAYMTASVAVTANLGPEARETDIQLRRMAVRLPEHATHSALDLDRNPDIVFIEDVAMLNMPDRPEATQRTGPPLHIKVTAPDPFWVRRDDFSVQLMIDIDVVVDETGARLTGEIEFRRGWIELLGKSFELQQGTITFAGGDSVDPILDLTAIYASRGDTTQAITVVITGRASEPELAFSSTVPGVETENDIFQFLLTGRTGEDTSEGENLLESQVSSMVSGVTSGLLTQTARQVLGDAAPTLSVRTGDYMRDVQVNAGFDANRLIPGFLQGIVTGIYVEGYVNTSAGDEETNTQRSTTAGVLLEFFFPRGFSTSGRFQPPTTWALDLMWQP